MLWEKEKLHVRAISHFPTMFSTLLKTEIIFFVTFVVCKCFQFGLVQNFVVWEYANKNCLSSWEIILGNSILHHTMAGKL